MSDVDVGICAFIAAGEFVLWRMNRKRDRFLAWSQFVVGCIAVGSGVIMAIW